MGPVADQSERVARSGPPSVIANPVERANESLFSPIAEACRQSVFCQRRNFVSMRAREREREGSICEQTPGVLALCLQQPANLIPPHKPQNKTKLPCWDCTHVILAISGVLACSVKPPTRPIVQYTRAATLFERRRQIFHASNQPRLAALKTFATSRDSPAPLL
jgi:hypothetical protein